MHNPSSLKVRMAGPPSSIASNLFLEIRVIVSLVVGGIEIGVKSKQHDRQSCENSTTEAMDR